MTALPKRAVHYLAIMCLALCGVGAHGHDDLRVGFQVRHYTLSSQVGGNDVNAVARTSDGYLWVGTASDLYRYNGDRFVSVAELFGTRRLRVQTLHVIDDVLYVGTSGRGVFRIAGGAIRQFGQTKGLSNDVVWGFAGTPATGLYVATSEGVDRLRGSRFEPVPGFDGLVSAIALDASGGLWARYADASLRRSGVGGASVVDLDGAAVYSLHAHLDGAIWLGTDRGLLAAANASAPFEPVPRVGDDAIGQFTSVSTGEAWLGSLAGGLWHLRDGTWQHRHLAERLQDTRLRTLFGDAESGLWIGTRNGLAQVLGGEVVALGPQFSDADVWAVTTDRDGMLWMATDGTGIARIDPEALTMSEPLEGLPSTAIWALAPSPGGGMWAGSGDAGAFLVRDGRVARHVTDLPVPQVWCILEAPDGTLLIGTDGGGLVRWRDGQRRVFDSTGGLAGDRVWALREIAAGSFWVGTNNGLCRLDGDDLRCQGRADGLPGNAVWAIEAIDDEDFWVSTDEGLARVSRDGTIEPVRHEPLSNANVFATHTAPGGDLWALSAQGLHRIARRDVPALTDPALDAQVVGRTFGPADGLSQTLQSGASPAMATDADGGLWLATSAGLMLVQTGELEQTPVDARLRLESAHLDGVAQSLDGEALRIAPGTRQVRIDYAALNFRYPEQTAIRYRLLGDTERWSAPTRERSLTFSNLEPGGYELQIALADNAYGLYAEPLRLGMELLPFWHQRGDVRLLAVGLLVLLTTLAYRWRLAAATAAHRARAEAARKELAAALRVAESESRYQDIFSGVKELVLLVDPQGRILEANPAATELVPDCRQGARLDDVLPRREHAAAWRIEVDDAQGRPRTLDLRASPRRDGTMLVVGHDVTDELTMQARSAAAQRLEAIGKLTAGVAHDFNNLLTVIMGNAAMLAEQVRDETARDRVRAVLDASQRAADITGKLLSIGRRQTVRPQRVNLNDQIAGMKDLLERVIEEHITVRFDLRGAPSVVIDTGLLEQIVLNLVINARDAIKGRGEIHIETRPVILEPDFIAHHPGLKPGPHVQLTIADTGQGMDAQTLERAFEPFFTTKPLGEGSGLGLATVYGAVKQCEGSIFITSKPDQGTRIDVYLPASTQPVEVVLPTSADAPERGAPARILVVEDSPAILELLQGALASEGHDVTITGSTQEAEAAYAPGRFDLIVSDVILADGTGPELVARLRARPPVLFISGYSHDHLDGLDGDDVELLPKPFGIEALIARSRALIETGRTAARAAAIRASHGALS